MLAQFLAKHNMPFTSSSEILQLCKHMFKDSQIAGRMTCGVTKATVVTNVLGTELTESIKEIIRNTPFALVINESNDRSSSKVLAVLVRHFSTVQKKSVTFFLALLECNIGTALNIFNSIDTFFEANHIPWKNVAGFQSENCSVMKGKTCGDVALIRKKIAICI